MNDATTALEPNGATGPSRFMQYFNWWITELRGLVPPRVMSWVVGDVAISDVEADAAFVTLPEDLPGKPAGRVVVPVQELSSHRALAALRDRAGDQVRLVLKPGQFLQKTVMLPAAVEENLRDVMGFELDRHTPFTGAQAYFDARMVRRDAQRDMIEVLLVVAARQVVDPLRDRLRGAGLVVAAIGIGGAGASDAIDLLPSHERPPRRWGRLLKWNLALLAIVVALAFVALLLPVWQKREEVIALIPQAAKAGSEFEASKRLHDEYTKLAAEYAYITNRKHAAQPAIAVLEELSRISVDTTSAQSLDLKSTGKSREVTLIGEAQAASKMIEALEQSPMFQNAVQRSQTRRGSQGSNEWFHIATEVKPRPTPPSVVPDESFGATVAAPPPAAPPVPPAAAAPETAKVVVPPPAPAAGAASPTPAASTPALGTPAVKTAPPPAVVIPPPAPTTAADLAAKGKGR